MAQTPLMMEFQLTQEYLGQGTHLVYEAPLLKEVLESDTYANGKGSTVAKIIDGYHRIAGLEKQEGKWEYGQFELNVTIFIDMDPEDEAIVFSTINKQQTKPSNSLAYDLFELAKTRSPQKTSHNIARLFNKEQGNPFYKKIKLKSDFKNNIII